MLYQSLSKVVVSSLLFISSLAFSGQVCNQSNVRLDFAIAGSYWCDGTGGPFNEPIYCDYSRGWYTLQRGACMDPGNFSVIYAEGEFGNKWYGEGNNAADYCIRNGTAFEFTDRDRANVQNPKKTACAGQGGRFVKFRPASNSSFTFTGGALPPTTLNVCNKSSTNISLAIATLNNAGWRSQGWYNISSGSCYNLKLGSYDGDIYLYGKGADGRFWGKNGAAFCVQPSQAFDIPNSDSNACQAPYQRPTFNKWRVSAHQSSTYNLNN